MCLAFEDMIDKAEDTYGVVITVFCCDNNGGSQRGRKDFVLKGSGYLALHVAHIR